MAASVRAACLLLVTAGWVSALPSASRDACTVKTQRKAWQNLTTTERSDYIKATLCLQNTPAKAGIPGAITRWDELQYAHIAQSDYIHTVGSFLPWHRYFITVHEHLLTTECGYKGAMPYWDEPLDTDNLLGSVIFDPKTGFGGNGVGFFRCIADGPFANLTLRFTQNLTPGSYCITRTMNNCFFKTAAQKNVDECMSKTNYEDAWHCLEGQPHGAGHGGVGGIMVNVQLSPGDPLFWLHHTYLDSLWWRWQSQDLTKRVKEIGGANLPPQANFNGTFNGTFGPPPGVGPPPDCLAGLFGNGTFPPFNGTFPPFNASNPFPGASGNGTVLPFGPAFGFKENAALTHYFNDGGPTTTMNHTLWSAGVFPNATIADVMDIRGTYVCAEYL